MLCEEEYCILLCFILYRWGILQWFTQAKQSVSNITSLVLIPRFYTKAAVAGATKHAEAIIWLKLTVWGIYLLLHGLSLRQLSSTYFIETTPSSSLGIILLSVQMKMWCSQKWNFIDFSIFKPGLKQAWHPVISHRQVYGKSFFLSRKFQEYLMFWYLFCCDAFHVGSLESGKRGHCIRSWTTHGQE